MRPDQVIQALAGLIQQAMQSGGGGGGTAPTSPSGPSAPMGLGGMGGGNGMNPVANSSTYDAVTAQRTGNRVLDKQHFEQLQYYAQQGVPVERAYELVFGKPLNAASPSEVQSFTQLYGAMANPSPGQTMAQAGAPQGLDTSGGGAGVPPGAAAAALQAASAQAGGGAGGSPGGPAASGPAGGAVPPPGGGGPAPAPTPAAGSVVDPYDTGYDPTQGGRSIRNAMSALGLPLIGPMVQRNMAIGNIGLGQALASPGAFATGPGEGGFQNFMQSRLGGQLPGGSNESRIGNLQGLEGMANSLLAGKPGSSLQDIVSQGNVPFSDPSQAGQFAYLASIAEDPAALGSAFASQFGGTSLSPGLTNLVGTVLGQVLQRQNDMPGSRNQRFAPFSNLRSLFGNVQ